MKLFLIGLWAFVEENAIPLLCIGGPLFILLVAALLGVM